MKSSKFAVMIFRLALTLVMAVTVLSAQAAVPPTINYQGQLSNAAGVPVNATVSMAFNLYDVATGGTPLWSETQSVAVSDGLYNVTLGQTAPLTSALFATATHLGITVAADAEMTPRIALSSAPYAMLSSCMPGDQMDCYTGAVSTRNVGACNGGKRTCGAAGWEAACSGEALPITEIVNGLDDNCDGMVDNGAACGGGLTNCNDACVNLSTAPGNCGQCGNACGADPYGGPVCSAGACVCDSGYTTSTFYLDADQDGYGWRHSKAQACSAPPGYTSDASDCDDWDAWINPRAVEYCGDYRDNNCDGRVDEGCLSWP